jgi:hypothetical protein
MNKRRRPPIQLALESQLKSRYSGFLGNPKMYEPMKKRSPTHCAPLPGTAHLCDESGWWQVAAHSGKRYARKIYAE